MFSLASCFQIEWKISLHERGSMKVIKKTIRTSPKKKVISLPNLEKKKALYDTDFFKWLNYQAKLLKNGEFEKLDVVNLIEEIESLGKSDKRALRSQLVRLLIHLLKLHYLKEEQGSILGATREIKLILEDSPSLKNELTKIFPEAYEDAKQEAAVETSLNIKKFPPTCP